MKKGKKRATAWLFILAASFTLGNLVGITKVRAEGVVVPEGLVISSPNWDASEDGNPVAWPGDAVDWTDEDENKAYSHYGKEYNMSPYWREVAYLGTSPENPLSVEDSENIVVQDEDGNAINGALTPYMVWDEEKEDSVPQDNGFFELYFEKSGDYTVTYEEDTVTIHVGLPEIGVYSSAEDISDSTYIIRQNNDGNESVAYKGNEDNTYYIVLRKTEYLSEDTELVVSAPEEIDIRDVEDVVDGYLVKSLTIPKGSMDDIEISANYQWPIYDEGVDPVKDENEALIMESRDWDSHFIFYLEKTGLLIAENFWDINTENPIDSIGAMSKFLGLETKGRSLVYFGYYKSDGENETITPVDVKDITISADGGADKTAVTIEEYMEWSDEEEAEAHVPGAYWLSVNSSGTYYLEYEGSKVKINADLPLLGLYSDADSPLSDANLIGPAGDNLTYDSDEDNTYYIRILDEEINNVKRVKVSIEGIDEKGLAWDENNKSGSITIPKGTLNDVVLRADVYWVSDDGSGEAYDGYTREFRISPEANGLVVTWGDVDNPDVSEKNINEFRKKWDEAVIRDTIWLTLAIASNAADGGKQVKAVPAVDIENIKIYDENSEDAIAKSVAKIYDSNMGDGYAERNVLDGIFVFYFNKSGTYTIKYEKDDVSESCVLVVNTPVLSFHKTPGKTDETDIVGNEYYNAEYEITEEKKEFYINILDDIEERDGDGNVISKETFAIKDIDLIIPEGKTEDDYKNFNYEISDDNKSATLTVYNKQYASIDLDVVFERKHYSLNDDGVLDEDWAEVWNDSPYEGQPYQRFSIGVLLGLYTDGAPQQGFAGMYVSEKWFNDPSIAWEDGSIERPMYWVHADSIQAVIDKLASAAKVGEVVAVSQDGDGEVPLEVVNTGYISVNLSGYGDEEIPPQYIASSGNLKGIIVNGSGAVSPYFLRHDDVLKGLAPDIGDSDSVHVCNAVGYINLFNENVKKPADVSKLSDEVVEKLNSIIAENEAEEKSDDTVPPKYGVVSLNNYLYKVTRQDKKYYNRDKKKNVTVYSYSITEEDSKNPIAEIDNAQAKYLWDEGDPEGIQCVMELPGVHANLYCDMKFIGDMGKLTIGYPDKSLASNDGEYFSAEIFYDTGKNDDGEVITKNLTIDDPDDYKDGTSVNLKYSTYEGNSLDIDATYTLTTYKIESEKKIEGSLDGVDVVVPEPNSLTELSYVQKDAIEEGKTLTVSMTADEVDAASSDEAVREGITAIQDEIAGDKDNEYGRIDFIDLSVKAAVEGEETQITETAVPMKVTIPIPKGYKKGTKFRIARYHRGKNGKPEVFFFDLVEKLLNDVGINIGYVKDETKGTITFLTDRFSTYALMEVGDDSRTEVDFSKTAWNYKEAFTADGTNKKVELTGLPEGVEVTYSGNEAKDVGKYTAKAEFSVTDAKSYKLPDKLPAAITSLSWEIKAAAAAPVTPNPAGASETTTTPTTPAPAEVGATVTDTSSKGVASTATYTVTDKSAGAGNAGKVEYSGESAGSTAVSITIPDTIVGSDGITYEVTKIADNALKGNKTVKEVIVGNNIVEIGVSAFQNATKLTTVKLGKNVAAIDKNAFAGCSKLKKVTASGSKITTVAESAFSGDKALTSIDLSKSRITTIGKNAFSGDKKLKTIKINANALKKVGKNAFKNIKKKATIIIYAKDKKTYNKAVKLIKKSGAKNVKYKFKKKK